MKMKSLIITVLLTGFTTLLSAQEFTPQVGYSVNKGYQTNFKKNRAGDNWFISAGAGIGMMIGDNNSKADFTDRLSVNPHLSFGKWMNPYFGMRGYITGGSIHGFETRPAGELYMQHNRYISSHLDFMYDITNHLGRYNEKKVFRVIPWVGVGYAKRFRNNDQNRSAAESPTLNAGILTAFRLSKRVDFNIELQGMLLSEEFNNQKMGTPIDIIGYTNMGFTFKLGRTDFEVIEPMDYRLLNNLNDRINALRAENDELRKRPVSCPDCPQIIPPKAVNNYGENIVYFRINSANIDANQEINIYNTANLAKASNLRVKVVGYADKATGTAEYNLQLSEKRAKAVAKELTNKYGIPSNQITIEWKGADSQPYDKNNWNRVVIMTVAE